MQGHIWLLFEGDLQRINIRCFNHGGNIDDRLVITEIKQSQNQGVLLTGADILPRVMTANTQKHIRDVSRR